jgi:predicted transcriptional regulator
VARPDLLQEVLALPDDEREDLLRKLLESIARNEEEELSDDELAEIEAGFADIERGEHVTAEDLLAQLRA